MHRICDRLWEIDAIREGRLSAQDAESSARHLRLCATCASVAARDAFVRALATSSPSNAPRELDLRRMRACVLREAAEAANRSPGSTRRVLITAVSIALACTALVFVRHRASPISPVVHSDVHSEPPANSARPEFAGVVFPRDGARWSQIRDRTSEQVRLDIGTLLVRVRHQLPDERFVVQLPDGQIEVRGTSFEVTVAAGKTEHVRVYEGVVALRIGGSTDTVLSEGSTWDAERTPVAAPSDIDGPPPARPEARKPRRVQSVSVEPIPSARADDGADAYSRAVELFEARRYPEAAIAFRDFMSEHPSSDLGEDATFLEGAALARAGRLDAAALVAEQHLHKFPHSFHRKDASILVARAARDRGDCALAARILEPWVTASDPEAKATLAPCNSESH